MKTFWTNFWWLVTVGLALIALGRCRASAQTNWTISWTPSTSVVTGPTNMFLAPDGYVVWFSTNVAQPFTNWTLAASTPGVQVSGTNWVPVTNLNLNTNAFPPSPWFFTVQYSNSLGVSPFSNLAAVQGPPVNPQNVKMLKQ